MRAVVQNGYGSPDVLELKDIEKQAPNEGQVLVKVLAASVNPLDWHGIRGSPFFARFLLGLTKPKDPRVGADFSGIVESVGSGVTGLEPGNQVYGICSGSFADYALARADRVGPKPFNLTFEEAAAVPVAATTALQGLRDAGHIKSGQKMLVNGASGGVGSFAVQIAKQFGTEVTAVTSTRNVEIVRSIGADHIVDYTGEDFTRSGVRYDLIFDAVGNRSVSDYKRALNPGGICVVAGFGGMSRLVEYAVLGPLRSKGGSRKVGIMSVAKVTRGDLGVLKEMIEAGRVRPLIDRTYPLEKAAEAVRYLETMHARGKVVIEVGGEQSKAMSE